MRYLSSTCEYVGRTRYIVVDYISRYFMYVGSKLPMLAIDSLERREIYFDSVVRVYIRVGTTLEVVAR